MPSTHVLTPGKPVDLTALPTRADDLHPSKAAAVDEFKMLRKRLVALQRRLYAEGKQKLLVVLQAMDAGGKDGTIRNIFRGVNPQGVRVASFKKPTEVELEHDFLWRVHKVVPRAGYITAFNRSHYEDVLVVRVHDIVPESIWRPRYAAINGFEQLLTESGTHILKFYLHLSKEEQTARFRARLTDSEKQWKFSPDDLEKAKFWDAYMAAYQEMVERCTTTVAPWHIIPADQKWYRNLAIMRTIVDRLETMCPEFPPLEYDPAAIEIT